MKKIFFIPLLLLFAKCNVIKENSTREERGNSIEVIKFMQSVNEYPMAIDERTFWIYNEEHAKLEISIDKYGNFLDEIKKLPKDKGDKFSFLKYAFLVRKGTNIDTVYVDYELKIWNFMKNGKRQSYYDAEGINAEELRHKYSFFKACW